MDPADVVSRPPLRYNDFGWTLGGPVYIPGHYKRLQRQDFFFFSQEFRRIVTTTNSFAIVPTAAELQGNFDELVCTTPVFDNTTGACIGPTTTAINPASFNPGAVAYIQDVFSKVPHSLSSSDHTVILPGKNIFNYRQELFRLDHTFNSRLMVTGRFINDTIPTINPNGCSASPTSPVTRLPARLARTQPVDPRHMTFSHNLLNEAGLCLVLMAH